MGRGMREGLRETGAMARAACSRSGPVRPWTRGLRSRQPHSALALEEDQIERGCVARKAREQGMDLPAVVGLVVEEVEQSGGERLFELGRVGDVAIADPFRQRPVAEAL